MKIEKKNLKILKKKNMGKSFFEKNVGRTKRELKKKSKKSKEKKGKKKKNKKVEWVWCEKSIRK